MGATYTRQSSYTDGDVITAAHTNDEFNQLLAAFQASSGHTHDGTANEGGPITKLLGNTLTFGAGTAGTAITITGGSGGSVEDKGSEAKPKPPSDNIVVILLIFNF